MSETPNPTNDLMNDLLKDPFDQSAPVVTEEASPQAEASIINKLSPEPVSYTHLTLPTKALG